MFDEFDAHIFDCDGTLADTMPAHYIAWRATLDALGVHLSEQRFYALSGVPAPDIVAMLAAEHGLTLDADRVAHEKESLFHRSIAGVLPIDRVVALVPDACDDRVARPDVHVDHMGWRPGDRKIAVLRGHAGESVELRRASDGSIAATYTATGAGTDDASGAGIVAVTPSGSPTMTKVRESGSSRVRATRFASARVTASM